MMNCLHILATILSLLGIAAAVLIITGTIASSTPINHHGEHHE